ncbi:MAG: LCP family protein [Lachnospiraceae bacterium]|nr:LCP family protein [Lachnospiraceae bacterium]
MKINAKLYRVLLKVMTALVVLIIIGTVGFVITTVIGRNNLYGKNKGQGPDLTGFAQAEVLTEETVLEDEIDEVAWQEGDIRYEGEIYRYNEDILTFLFLGIDKNEEARVVDDGIKGGQSDALFLLVLNPHTEEMTIIGIPRDTITDVDIYGKHGDYIGTTPTQISLQHGYGDGDKLSCERSVKAVSGLFYELPIHGYCSINMGGIPLLNDAIGGVEVTALQDVPRAKIKEGETVLLMGQDAYHYLHDRDTKIFASAEARLARQKQYITAYIGKAKAAVKEDITLAVKLYSTVSKYMVTDITVDEVSYLATQASNYSFDDDHISVLKGDVKIGADGFEEFHVDEAYLYELILDTFYEKISPQEQTP